MTTKPRAKKFRIRRSGSLAGQPAGPGKSQQKPAAGKAAGTPDANPFEGHGTEDGFGDEPFPTAAKARKPAEDPAVTAEIEAIRKEGLTSRQLRMARRVAQKYGLEPTSDYDAIRLLRKKGVDPFQRSTMLELVVPDGAKGEQGDKLPSTKVKQPGEVPSTEVMSEDQRAREIYRIQRDIARRRRRKTALLFVRLLFFVFLPTFLVGYYYYNIATPLYATKSEFLIQQADNQGGGGSLGGLFSGTGLATSQDAITVQSYLQSREAMLRLDEDIGFKSHFSQEFIDPLLRLPPDASNEEAYKLYKRLVKIGYDPTEGIIRMEVAAADPKVSEEYSLALIKYAEEQVDNLSKRLREDQMKGARESYIEAENKMIEAQNRVLELQEKLGVIDPASETSALMGQITNFETQLQEKKLQLQQLLDNPRPNQARVDGVKGDIKRLENLVAELRSQLTSSGSETASLARITGELRLAENELQTRQAMMQQALQQLEMARIEANRQVRYLSLGVRPVAPDEPTYPRAFENTFVAFLIFSGIYLMVSLTASVLREQISA
jgi:capsular polysaccharide transport system permease protein